jgi:hypothetical protein
LWGWLAVGIAVVMFATALGLFARSGIAFFVSLASDSLGQRDARLRPHRVRRDGGRAGNTGPGVAFALSLGVLDPG